MTRMHLNGPHVCGGETLHVWLARGEQAPWLESTYALPSRSCTPPAHCGDKGAEAFVEGLGEAADGVTTMDAMRL